MIVVADASVLVAELVRARGRALLRDARLDISISEEQRSETNHELERRLRFFDERLRVRGEAMVMLRQEIAAVIDTIEVVRREG